MDWRQAARRPSFCRATAPGRPQQLENAPYQRFVQIGEGTHTVMLEKNRMQFIHEVAACLEEPMPQALDRAALLSAARTTRMVMLGVALLLTIGGAARGEERSPAVIGDLAPTGVLRAAINLGNSVLAGRDAGGAVAGVSVDLARALGERLGVPVTLVPYDSAGAVSGAATSGAWDICFLAVDPKRAEHIVFSAPYVVIEGSYLVPAGSPVEAGDAVDQPGVRIAVGQGSAYDLFLTRVIRRATLVRAPTSSAALTMFVEGKLEVAANVRQPLAAYAASHPKVRLLPGHFMEIAQAMGVRKDRPAGAAYLRAFVEEMKSNGFVARALSAHGQDAALAARG